MVCGKLLVFFNIIQTTHHLYCDPRGNALPELHIETHTDLLETVLEPFAHKNCFVLLRNHMNVDLKLSSIPLISQHFIPKLKADSNKVMGWIPISSRARFIEETSALYNSNITCPSSYFIKPDEDVYSNLVHSCISIREHKWIMSGRPGNCKIIIDFLLPPFMAESHQYYPLSEYVTANRDRSVPHIHMLFTLHQPISKCVQSVSLHWAWLQLVKHGDGGVNEEPQSMLIIIVRFNKTGRRGLRLETYNPILGKDREELVKQTVSFSEWNRIKLKKIADWKREGNAESYPWRIVETPRHFRSMGRISQRLSECSRDFGVTTRLEESSSVEARTVKMDKAHAHILRLIIGNSTYFTPGEGCVNNAAKILYTMQAPEYAVSYIHIAPYDRSRNISNLPSILLNNSLIINVRFMVCGDRGKTGHEFHQLISAFQY